MNARFATARLVALPLLSLSLAGPINAQSDPAMANAIPSQIVRYADLDLTSPEDLRTLYGRIRHAAWKVCREIVPAGNGPSAIENGKCQRTLVDLGVKDVNRPALSTLHTKRNVEATARR
jgi:UrcA family protein